MVSHAKHHSRVRSLLDRLKATKLTVNLLKSEFGHAHVTYLGYVVGQGQVSPVSPKYKQL